MIHSIVDEPDGNVQFQVSLKQFGRKAAHTGHHGGHVEGAANEPFQVRGVMNLLQNAAERPHPQITHVIMDSQNQRCSGATKEKTIIRSGMGESAPHVSDDSGQQRRKKRQPWRIVNHPITRKTSLDALVKHMSAIARCHRAEDISAVIHSLI